MTSGGERRMTREEWNKESSFAHGPATCQICKYFFDGFCERIVHALGLTEVFFGIKQCRSDSILIQEEARVGRFSKCKYWELYDPGNWE